MSSSSTSAAPASGTAGQVQLRGGGTRDSAGKALTLVDGRTGAGVTAVTIERSDGSSVQATVANGWYLAWWPGTVTATNAEVTTASGTTTVAFPSTPALPAAACPSGAHCAAGYSFGSGDARAGESSTSGTASAGQSTTAVRRQREQQRELVPLAGPAPPGVARKPPRRRCRPLASDDRRHRPGCRVSRGPAAVRADEHDPERAWARRGRLRCVRPASVSPRSERRRSAA